MTELLMTVAVITGMIMTLTGLILAAKAVVTPGGEVTVVIDGRDEPLRVERGRKLLSALLDAGLPIPAACGGKGTCGACRVRVTGALDAPLATELAVLDAHALSRNVRLACQVTLRGDLQVGLADGLPSPQTLDVRIRSNKNLTLLIKELVLELPEGAPFSFRAGSFVQLECPPHRTVLGQLPVDEAYQQRWAALGVQDLAVACDVPTTRAYSLANHPGEGRVALLYIRLALPPPGAPPGTPPGIASSYLFSLKPRDAVRLSGPFGHFMATDTDKEMVLVGGGVGMAPLRAHVFEQLEGLHTKRRLSLWYGARTPGEILCAESFDRLAAEHPNFTWSVAVSEPDPQQPWAGARGFVHEHLRAAFLAKHPHPADCEYYLCGPPLMIRAVVATLEQFKVPRSSIFYDDFGA